ESATDSGTDATMGRDGGFDGGRDAAADSAFETAVDGGHDAGHDAGLDGGHDGSSDAAAEAGHDAGADSGPDAGPLRFGTSIYAPIVGPVCKGCHGLAPDGGPGVGLEFGHLDFSSEEVAYDSLLGDGGGVVAAGSSCGGLGVDAGLKRVFPDNAMASLLYNKVLSNNGDGGNALAPDGGPLVFCGSPMPLHQTALSAAELTAIRDWIQQGALP
ncbi:MAG: MSCRAMM family adhesin SdrC, partial [Myxococcota bacterium]|nr:MSCRAMM family adhesin SdrC [Myxococcota bacterium]